MDESVGIYFVRGDCWRSSLGFGRAGVNSINGISSWGFADSRDRDEYIKVERLSLSLAYGLCKVLTNGSDCVSVEFERGKIKLD
jgi:hypothetical protein